MPQSESQIQNAIIRRLKNFGWYVNKFEMSESGWPDLICFRNGTTVFIEVKRVGAKPRPLQVYRIKQANEMGIQAFWSDSKDHPEIDKMCK